MRAWTMSSEISTDSASFRPWHFFALAGLACASIAVYVVRPGDVASLVLLVLAVAAGAYVGLAVYSMFLPLMAPDVYDRTEMIGTRTRAALDREKTLVLRSIKELEFDRAMGKVSDSDFSEMSNRLRQLAKSLLRQLDADGVNYRDRIERELADLLRLDSQVSESPRSNDRRQCANCGTSNESDSEFCKSCAVKLEELTS